MQTTTAPDPQATEAKARCVARTKRGKPCRSYAIAGLDKCRMHCGLKTQAAVEKGRMNIARDRIGAYLARQDLVYEDPIVGLLDEVARSAMATRVLGDLVADLEAHPKMKLEEGGDGITIVQAGIYGPDHLGNAKPHVLVQMWNEERERHARVCKLALDAGVAERQVRVAEEQAIMFAQVIARIFDDPALKLSTAQKIAGRRIAAAELRALPSMAS